VHKLKKKIIVFIVLITEMVLISVGFNIYQAVNISRMTGEAKPGISVNANNPLYD